MDSQKTPGDARPDATSSGADGHEPNYRAIAEFRYQIRRFLRFDEKLAHSADLKLKHYQLLVAIKGMPEGTTPCLRNLAERLQIRRNSASELIDEAVRLGLVCRRVDNHRGEMIVGLTRQGKQVLRAAAGLHRSELDEICRALLTCFTKLLRKAAAVNARVP